MTNEELIEQIRGGAAECMAQLFENNRGMIAIYARKYCNTETDPALSMDDFMQEGYIALSAAAAYYQPEKGAFITVLPYFLQRHMRELAGVRTSCRRADRGAVRLDAPIEGSDDAYLVDMLADSQALEPFDTVERMEVQAVMREALQRLPAAVAKVIQARHGLSAGRRVKKWEDISFSLGITEGKAKRLYKSGITALHRDGKLLRLVEEYYANCYVHVGVGAYRSTRTSSVELAAMLHEAAGLACRGGA